MTERTYNVITEKMTHFDCRDIEDLIKSKKRNNDFTATQLVWDNQRNCWTYDAPAIEWYGK